MGPCSKYGVGHPRPSMCDGSLYADAQETVTSRRLLDAICELSLFVYLF